MTLVVDLSKTSIVLSDGNKIYDITHADTVEHTIALPAGAPTNTKYMLCRFTRPVGTGSFRTLSVSGGGIFSYTSNTCGIWPRAADGLFYYRISVNNDEWDIFCQAYFTE